MSNVKDCSTCRHHQKQPRAKPTGWQEGAYFELADENQPSYRCGAPSGPHAGNEVGLLPTLCDAYEAGQRGVVGSTLQGAVDAWEARMAARAKRESEQG